MSTVVRLQSPASTPPTEIAVKMMRALATSLLISLQFATASAWAAAQPTARAEPVPAQTKAQATCDEAYQLGIAGIAANNFDAAETAFKSCLKVMPKHTLSTLGLAEVAFRQGKRDDASALIKAAAAADPGNANAQASLGRLLAIEGNYAEAEKALQQAVALDSQLVGPRMDLADLYATALRKPEEAIRIYESVIATHPEHAGAHYALGIVRIRSGQLSEAVAPLERAASLDPANPLPLVALARVSAQGGDLKLAQTQVGKALEIDPDYADALELRGDIYMTQGDRAKALADFSAAAGKASTHPMLRVKIGMLQQGAGKDAEAVTAYEEALKLDPRLAIALNNLAWIDAERGKDLDLALSRAQQAVEIAPANPDFHDTLGWVHRARGELAEAERILSTASTMSGANADIHYHLGLVLRAQGKHDEAVRAFKQSVALNAGHQGAQAELKALGVDTAR